MQTPQLVASDVDGTLLDPLETVTTRTAKAVAGVLAAEVPFVLASGRPPRWMSRPARAAGVCGYAVCANGAVLYDITADQVLAVYGLSAMLLRDAVHAIEEAMDGCSFAVERVGTKALDLDGHEFLTEENYRHPWPTDPARIVPRAELLGRPAIKLLVCHDNLTSGEIVAATTAVLGDAVGITYSSSAGMIEVSAPDVTKATGLAEVAGWLDVPRERVIAFGDMPNDLEMLRWAGHGVAMANAHPSVLAVADEVTASNSEDGVAQVLERWF